MAGVQVEGDAAELHPLRIRVSTPVSPGPDSLDTPDDSCTRGTKRPRREEAALFLEKTYELLERCPPDLASWTAKGDSFVVKQPSAFAEHVIPTYFKHRKFSSFVRQLNLYGFRKVRAASASTVEEAEEEDASPKDWWEFRHERFVRGRRDLLCFGLRSPEDVAVRELSRIAAEIRSDLLACITARVTGFLRVHRDQTDPTREADADAVGEAVGSDIRQQLALLQASTTTSDPKLLDAETTCMYRVEILKFISRELPRAVQDAVDKRLPAPEKLKQRSAKDRSLLALLVQKAQKALERQMHTETAAVSAGRR
ncbi:hypothetical protein JG687_00004064 [Phytophthora cactorum]|uniref:HSF-type DNA-binding domain-containing protein n=1 Tax=Phytophthora cactorum TaxID=29920 RepID=A0A8T1USK2_9STRA|nr:hypothetical protein JG687_00004064 [Phytophthora cactorum]